LDLADRYGTERVLRLYEPDAVVCCASWPWVDGCEGDPERAWRENCQQPAMLAEKSHAIGARFVFLSSSYVFDGEKGPYSEDAPTNPINVYGASKLAGEQACLEATGHGALIVRTMGVYGEEAQRKNFVYQLFDTLSAGKHLRVANDQFGNATHSDDLADTILMLLEKGFSGIRNAAGPEPRLARHEFASRIAREYTLDSSLLDFIPTSALNQAAKRPAHGGLLIERSCLESGIMPAKWVKIRVK
jgi:dTDP-4-dehydrorhamnose reductase